MKKYATAVAAAAALLTTAVEVYKLLARPDAPAQPRHPAAVGSCPMPASAEPAGWSPQPPADIPRPAGGCGAAR